MTLVAACGGGGGAQDAAPPVAADAAPLPPTRAVDVLFVVDNSGTTGELQTIVAGKLWELRAQLTARFGGELPDVHIGVVSGDVGIGGFTISSGCAGEGDDGRLQNLPRGPCVAPGGLWIEDVSDGAGGRTRNYGGMLEEALACIAKLGNEGCGFQQHLEAIRRALDGRHAEHAGFLRDDAILAVIIVADDDDCTAADPAVYDPSSDAGVGPLSSARCAFYGWLCNGEPIPPIAATYTDCTPRTDSYLVDPLETVAFLQGLKADPRMVVMAGVFPDRTPVLIDVDPSDGTAGQTNICPTFPHSTNIRDRAAVDALGGVWGDGCDEYPIAEFGRIADHIADRMGAPPTM